jgi:hypothetical protein
MTTSDSNKANYTQPFAWPFLLLAAVLVLWRLLDFMAAPLLINWDVAMYLQIGGMLLDGGIPYIDIVDINPPLVWYLHTVPVGLGRMLDISSPLAFNLLLVFAAIVSSALSYKLLAKTQDDDYAPAIIALVPLISLHWFSVQGMFGQREHIFILALLPFLILRILRYRKADIRIPTAVFTGLLIAATAFMKAPHFGFILVVAELTLAWRYKTIRPWVAPEIITVAVFGVAYIAHFFLLPEAAGETFFTRYVPLIMQSYDAYATDPGRLQNRFIKQLLLPLALAMVGTIIISRHRTGLYYDLALLALLTSICGAIGFWLQGKGWPYHSIPTVFGALLVAAVIIGQISVLKVFYTRIAELGNAFGSKAVCALAILFCIVIITLTPKEYGVGRIQFLSLFESYSEPGDAVMMLSASVPPGYPALVQAERKSGSRHLFSFVVPMLYSKGIADPTSPHGYSLPPDLQEEETLFLQELSEDIVTLKPKLILLENAGTCLYCPPEFSIFSYFTHNQQLMSLINSKYTRIEEENSYAVFVRNAE